MESGNGTRSCTDETRASATETARSRKSYCPAQSIKPHSSLQHDIEQPPRDEYHFLRLARDKP